MKANSRQIILKDLAIMFGLMVENMKDHGKITKCTEEEYSFGLTVEDMKENTSMTKSRDMVSSFGLMGEATRAVGETGSRTVVEPTEINRVCRSREPG